MIEDANLLEREIPKMLEPMISFIKMKQKPIYKNYLCLSLVTYDSRCLTEEAQNRTQVLHREDRK